MPRPAAHYSSLSFTATSESVGPLDSDLERPRLSDLGKLFRRGVRGVVSAARAADRVTLGALLRDHLGAVVDELEVVEESWPGYDHVNVQAGLDAWLAEPGRDHRLVGVVNFRHHEFGLTELLRATGVHSMHLPSAGNVSRLPLPSGPGGETKPCVRCGLYLVEYGDQRVALLLRGAEPDMGNTHVMLQVVAGQPAEAARAATDIRELALVHNVYRGQLVSFGGQMFGERETVLSFLPRPNLTAADVILPSDTLAAVERQVIGVAEHRQRLLDAGQHLKRGLLLYGPPGVGKTHTVRYLASRLTGTTIVELSGDSLALIEQACSIARTLQPSMVVVEDVDLIAEDRGRYPGQHPLLFQLLNQMDGLAEDADVVFLLTTNRADLLEPALASRPGRVDQAVEIQLPSADARRRLFALYRGALDVDESRLDGVIDRTDGVTASFLKELLRRAAVIAASDRTRSDGAPIRISAGQLEAALDELLDTRNSMTRVLLGGRNDD
ncbi:MAG TPA: ATP-binding protein [Nocardioidaceae bacterium]|nr:ATP-binding protein [Nocardioidaceae bacterium]